MLYVLFLVLAIAYNLKKFRKDRNAFLSSIVEAKNSSHRVMILGHHFYIFIFEAFLALIVAHLVSEQTMVVGILGLGMVYLALIYLGFYLYQFFIKYVERQTNLELYDSFKGHLIKELRVNLSMIMLPILVYSLINWTFQDSVHDDWGSLWFLGLLFNIIFVSVLTIVCSVILMLRLIPNRDIIEPEYLEIINKRLAQIQQPNMRIRWIETEIKNAFVVGLKLLSFSNQTMFIGKSLRTTLSLEEFDAVIAHELSHVANRHIHKRMIDLMKNFLSIIIGIGFLMLIILGTATLYWGDDAYLYTFSTTIWCTIVCLIWMVFNYSLLFDTIRSHEFEADAYAVIELGASINALKSALEKLSNTEEIPEYIKERTRKKTDKSRLGVWFSKYFSTHPEIGLRISFLEYKIAAGLPFNYYVSPAKKLRKWLSHFMNWKVSVPMGLSLVVAMVWGTWNLQLGKKSIAFINNSSSQKIMDNKDLIARINTRPHLIGQSLMYFIVRKRDPHLIDHFLKNGADKGKTLIYLSMLKDYELFEKYYSRFQNNLSNDEYVLVLRKTAQMNFTEGYRMLINAKQFEDLDPMYKEDVSRLHQIHDRQNNRLPASTTENKK